VLDASADALLLVVFPEQLTRGHYRTNLPVLVLADRLVPSHTVQKGYYLILRHAMHTHMSPTCVLGFDVIL